MKPKLIESSEDGSRVREIVITTEEFLIGRGADCNLRLAGSAISRHHCLLRFKGTEAAVTDLGSSNGTYINGKRVRTQAALHSGDEIRVGSVKLAVDLGDAVDLGKVRESDPTATTCKIPAVDAQKKLDAR